MNQNVYYSYILLLCNLFDVSYMIVVYLDLIISSLYHYKLTYQ